MNVRYARFIRITFNPQHISKAAYSRRDNSISEKIYEILKKNLNSVKDDSKSTLSPVPNWELLTPTGYRFYLPGNVGPGWHDVTTNPHSLPLDFDLVSTDLKFHAQTCPFLLKQNVSDLFPGVNLLSKNLTIITLSHKNFRQIKESEGEEAIKVFVLAAQDICKKLKEAGYWADFINPFSGLPGFRKYNCPTDLYQSDHRFRNLGFRIIKRESCDVIEQEKTYRFKGHLFSTMPPSTEMLKILLLP